MNWWDRANCRGADIDIFYPGIGQSAQPAKHFCNWCKVVPQCLAFAADTQPGEITDHGIFGARTVSERQNLRMVEA